MTKQALVLRIRTCSSNEVQLKLIELADPVSNWLISAQKVLFWTLLIIGFEHFLCTNQHN